MEKVYRGVNKVLEVLLVVIFSALVIDVFWQVFARYSFGKPNAFTEELARYLLIWLTIMGTAYVRSYQGQMAIDYLYNKLSPRRQRNLSLCIELCIILFALMIMVVGGINLMYITLKLGQIAPALNLPIGYVYSVVPLSGILIIFYSTYHCFHLFKQRVDETSGTDRNGITMN